MYKLVALEKVGNMVVACLVSRRNGAQMHVLTASDIQGIQEGVDALEGLL